jgi:hypothetical protein
MSSKDQDKPSKPSDALSFGAALTVGSRVVRSDGSGCGGTVQDVRREITQSAETRDNEKGLLVAVAWDNGTLSYFAPGALRKGS